MPTTIASIIQRTPCLTLSDSTSLYGGESPGTPLLVVDNAHCRAVIALQGAQLLEFKPKGQQPLLWLSPKASFMPGKAVRGGIPVCAPWFGPHATDATKPQHGFARNNDWSLIEVEENENNIKLNFQLQANTAMQQLHPWPLTINLQMTLGSNLNLNFSVTHDGDADSSPMPFSWALHSYFPVTDISHTTITGLPHSIRFDREVDLLMTQVPDAQRVESDEDSEADIVISGEHCPSAIVWNPGSEKAALMADLGVENQPGFVCVERGAAGSDGWTLTPGETRSATVSITRK